MKVITIEPKSFLFGILAAAGLLLMANKPAAQPQPEGPVKRYQVAVSERSRTIILDTQTGRFLVERLSLGRIGWDPVDFNEQYNRR